MSKEKKITILFVVLIFSYLLYLTSCLGQAGGPTGGEDAASSTSTDDVWVSSSTSTSIPTTSETGTEATEELIRLALNPAREVLLLIFRQLISWDQASARSAISG